MIPNPDPVILAGIALGWVGALILGSIVAARMAIGARNFFTRNDRRQGEPHAHR